MKLPSFVCVVAALFGLGANLPAQVTKTETPEPTQSSKVYHAEIVDSFAGNVVSLSGKLDPEVIKKKKYLFVYLSAHWCPPCRAFTPKLVNFYNQFYGNGDFDLVFVSFDRTQNDMAKYMREERMPWIGLKLKSKPAKDLQIRCGGEGIPCLILLDENDYVIAESHAQDGSYLGPYEALRVYAKIKDDEAAKAAK